MPRKSFWIGLSVFVLLVVCAIVGANAWVHAYLRSPEFLRLISAKTGQALQSTATYEPLQWSGSTAFSTAMTAEGLPGAALSKFDARDIRATVNWRAIFDGAWRIDEIDVVRLNAVLSSPGVKPSQPEPPPDFRREPRKRGWLPNRFELGRLSVQEANLTLGPDAQIKNSSVVMRPEGSGWLFEGSRGKLEVRGYTGLEVESYRVRLQQGTVYITEAKFRSGASGQITASGEIPGGGAPYTIRTEWENVGLSDYLQGEWGGRITGSLAGNAVTTGTQGTPAIVRGEFKLTDGVLEGVPVQAKIADFTRSPQFKRMPLHEVSGKFTYDGLTTDVKNFVAESKGLLRLEGNCRIGQDGSLSGVFEVGVTPLTLQWLPGSQEKVFTTSRNGYLWTTLMVGGTRDQPTEDLSARLARAMGEQVIETGLETILQTPNEAKDVIKQGLDLLGPLIR